MSNAPKVKKTDILEGRVNRLERTITNQAENLLKLAQVVERQNIQINELITIIVGKGKQDEKKVVSNSVGVPANRTNSRKGNSVATPATGAGETKN